MSIELKFTPANAATAVSVLEGTPDGTVDKITIEPKVIGDHPYFAHLILDGYRVLKDGGKMLVGAVDRATYGLKHPTIKNHFYEADLKDFFVRKAPYQHATFNTKGKFLIIEATKAPADQNDVRDTLLGSPTAKVEVELPVVLTTEVPIDPVKAAIPDDEGDGASDGATPAEATVTGQYEPRQSTATVKPHPASKEAREARRAAKAAATKVEAVDEPPAV